LPFYYACGGVSFLRDNWYQIGTNGFESNELKEISEAKIEAITKQQVSIKNNREQAYNITCTEEIRGVNSSVFT